MKILIITPGYLAVPAVNGGAVENLVDIIIKENEKLKKAEFTVIGVNDGIDIDVTSFKHTNYLFVKNASKIFKIKRAVLALINKFSKHYIGNAYIREVTKILKKDNSTYDAVIIENNPLYILNVKKYFKCPVYLHLHNDYLNNKTKLSEKVYSLYDGILTVRNYIGNRVKTINLEDKKTKTLYNGIELENFDISLSKEERKKIRAKYSIKDNDFAFLYTGRLIPEKGVKEMIQSFNNACKNVKNIKLLIVGSSSYKNGTKNQYISELQTLVALNKENIIFTGYVDYNDIPSIYKACDAQIVPSIWGEPLATTVIEGMASSLPLIVNNVGGIPEMVGENGEAAIITNTVSMIEDIEKSIIEFTENEKLCTILSKNGYQKSKKFYKTIFYENYIKMIRGE